MKTKANILLALGVFGAIIGSVQAKPTAAKTGDTLDRSVLPVAEPKSKALKEIDVRKAKAPVRFEVKAPKGAPNVVIVLIDDMGFGQPSTFGGGVAMPTLDHLANTGLRYNNMHVTALCSPTRAALLTGRNHHTNNTGAVQDIATAFPGNTGIRPNSVAPLAEMLRLNGYNTAAFGKWHLTPLWETTASGPFERWPTGSGFEKFYGFLGGETNHWSPYIFDGTARVELPHDPAYNFMTDMTDRSIAWVRAQQSLTPDKPFFVYFAPGATHAPHHAPQAWIDKYKGQFDAGWDKYREETLARQIRLGVVPPDTKLAPKPPAIANWETLSDEEKRLYARQMEVFAGFAEFTDHEVGRLATALEELGEMDNTVFIYIAGDNGASAEGGMAGMFNEMLAFNGMPANVAEQMPFIDKWGGPESYPHFAAGWAVAGNAPFAWSKQVAADYGGTKNGMVVHWPKGIRANGELRSQWHHVVDIAPTVLEIAGLPAPKTVNGTPQKPFEGTSLAYTFNDAKAANRHHTQYFEILGNRALYHDDWLARTIHRAPWERQPRAPFAEDKWELFDTRSDFSLANDLAARQPAKLKTMQALFLQEAVKYNVLPLDDRTLERFVPALAGRPDLMAGRHSLTLYEGMTGIMENAFIDVKNRSLTVTAEVEIPQNGANGVILAQGGRFGGWALYMKEGKPAYSYNLAGMQRTTIAAAQPLAAGKASIVLNFAYDGGGPGKGGMATLTVNGEKAAEGRIERTTPFVFSLDEGADVGRDEDTPVSEEYKQGDNRFNGKIVKVTVETKANPPVQAAVVSKQ
ncbi:MAG: arylsulfatase [Methylicorpusculum sp.]|uniref:arylsulfatase n=1 Tax=Methylicorpusculum sp. TaxID=2713644 RepID=UPI00272660D7|nr:arylsulfatase [Methylicorpusculum sp.]MDO8940340.1 arylsulfatase [Methylicorpusculum sp.]MDP2203797.1 arylsulfatase [Methylicorpusculum sp.]